MFAKFAIAAATAALFAITVGQSANAQTVSTSMARPSASTAIVVNKTQAPLPNIPSLPSTPVVQMPAPKPVPPPVPSSVPSKPTMAR